MAMQFLSRDRLANIDNDSITSFLMDTGLSAPEVLEAFHRHAEAVPAADIQTMQDVHNTVVASMDTGAPSLQPEEDVHDIVEASTATAAPSLQPEEAQPLRWRRPNAAQKAAMKACGVWPPPPPPPGPGAAGARQSGKKHRPDGRTRSRGGKDPWRGWKK